MPRKTDLKKSLLSKQETDSMPTDELTMKLPATSPSWTVYTSAKEIPFDKFIQICCFDKLDLLIQKGHPPLDVLESTWMSIYSEYNDIIDASFGAGLSDKADTEVMRAKIKLIGALINVLVLKPIPIAIKALQDLGFNYDFDPADDERYIKQLNSVNVKTKAWVLQVLIKDKEKNEESTEKVDLYEVFTQMIRELSKHMGFHIKPTEYTAYEFAIYFRDMQKDIAKNQKVNG